MDIAQLLLIIVSTVFAVIIGIQLYFVLKELRKTLVSINKIIHGFESVGSGIEHGFSEIMGFVNGLKTILKTIDIFSHKKDDKSD